MVFQSSPRPILPKFGVSEPIKSFLSLKPVCFCFYPLKPKNLKTICISVVQLYLRKYLERYIKNCQWRLIDILFLYASYFNFFTSIICQYCNKIYLGKGEHKIV